MIIKNQEGQAFTEYILLVSILVAMYITVTYAIQKTQLTQKLMASFTGPFRLAISLDILRPKALIMGDPLIILVILQAEIFGYSQIQMFPEAVVNNGTCT